MPAFASRKVRQAAIRAIGCGMPLLALWTVPAHAQTVAALVIDPTVALETSDPVSAPRDPMPERESPAIPAEQASDKHTPAAAPLAPASAAPPAPALAPGASPEKRLATIAYRLSRASAGACAQPVQLTGMRLHDAASYDPQFRPLLKAKHGVEYDFGVRELVDEGSAKAAGIAVGDRLIAINDTDLRGFALSAIGDKASFDRVAALQNLLNAELAKGPAKIALIRDGATLTVELQPEPGCGGEPVLVASNDLNAWADGHYIAVTTRMVQFAQTDDQLAFVVAHEMSHNLLHAMTRDRRALLDGPDRPAPRSKEAELQADRNAVTMMFHAGYAPQAASDFLEKVKQATWFELALSHPSLQRRRANVAREYARLESPPAPAIVTPKLAAEPGAGSYGASSSTRPPGGAPHRGLAGNRIMDGRTSACGE